MSLNYPLNPDTSFESFVLTNESDVQGVFGTTYSQNDLVPMNYNKVMLACAAGTLTYAPLREFVYISAPEVYGKIGNEVAFSYQGINLLNGLVELYNYWKTDILLIPSFQCPMGIVTEISTRILTDSTLVPPGDLFQIETRFKINWLVVNGKGSYS